MASYFDEELWYGSSAASEAEAEQKAAKSIAAKVGRIIGAKPFPIAAQRLGELTLDPNCPMQSVVDLLESDPALSARLLRLVNSAGYALRTSCTSVAHAAALVGVRKLHQVASTAAILDMYETSSDVAAATLEHAAIVGALCRYLAAHQGLPQDEMFTCGFLHDIGKLMLLESEGEVYSDMLRAAQDEPDTVYAQERLLLGYDHAILGGHVLSAWNIPAPVPKVVAWHHHVARAYDDSLQVARMVSVVRLADSISVALFRQFPEFEVERLARTEAASYLDISEPQIAAMWDEMFMLATRARAAFRGEPLEAAAANDVEPPNSRAASLRPREDVLQHETGAAANSQHTYKEPRFFPCVACGVPTYANVCRACGGYMCPAHQDKEEEWCQVCAEEYSELEIRFPSWVYGVVGSAIGAMLVGTLVGASGALSGRPLQVLVAPGLLSMLGVVCIWSWQRFFRRMWFLRTCPDRKSMLPAGPDAFEQPETVDLPVVSKRWIQPLRLDARGPVVREVWHSPVSHEVEQTLPAGPRSVNPNAAARTLSSERRVSLRPSLRANDDSPHSQRYPSLAPSGNVGLPLVPRIVDPVITELGAIPSEVPSSRKRAKASKAPSEKVTVAPGSKRANARAKPKASRSNKDAEVPSARASFRPGSAAPQVDAAFGDDFEQPPAPASKAPTARKASPRGASKAPKAQTTQASPNSHALTSVTMPAPASPARRGRQKASSQTPDVVVLPNVSSDVVPDVNQPQRRSRKRQNT